MVTADAPGFVSAAAKSRLGLGVLLCVVAFIQATFGADLRIAGVAPDLLALVAISAGYAGGAELGAGVGFCAGLLADLILTDTPIGLTALTLCVIGAGVGAVRTAVLGGTWAFTPVIAVVGTVLAVIGFIAFGDLVGQSQLGHQSGGWIFRVVLIEGLYAAILSLPVFHVVQRLARGTPGASRIQSTSGGIA